ncbi:unnamed protein product [Prorocentrum cordatum]|uniref:Uncharacterized protein n=1 Tax=Prorocentrum cordatum TaxID=2364126 RepID=A0ABN9T7K5_9DINO|nr:unnamed protein product [Polarella glacialis]
MAPKRAKPALLSAEIKMLIAVLSGKDEVPLQVDGQVLHARAKTIAGIVHRLLEDPARVPPIEALSSEPAKGILPSSEKGASKKTAKGRAQELSTNPSFDGKVKTLGDVPGAWFFTLCAKIQGGEIPEGCVDFICQKSATHRGVQDYITGSFFAGCSVRSAVL